MPAAIAFVVLLMGSALLLALSSSLEGLGSFWASPREWLLRLDPAIALDTLSNAAEVVAGVLAIAITVVAIVVELAATRYTHRITALFVREPVNIGVMSFFVLTTVQCVWIAATLGQVSASEPVIPNAGLALTLAMVTVCLLALLPYFAFVFSFLSPPNVIGRIRVNALDAIRKAKRSPKVSLKTDVLEAIEEIEDIARGAVEHSDRSIAMAGIDALADLMLEYDRHVPELPDAWFDMEEEVLHNPDFVSMAPVVLDEMLGDRLWVEVKIFRQYQALFTSSLNRARDVCNIIALNTQRIGTHATGVATSTARAAGPSREPGAGRDELLNLTVRFFNSYLRAAINANDLRTAYYMLNQYRLLVEAAVVAGLDASVMAMAEYFRYYGQLSYNRGQTFLLEAVAYDIVQVIQRGLDIHSPLVDPLINLLLEVDKESGSAAQEESLLTVRRAQVQLAALFLVRGEQARARRIYEDLKNERPERLIRIRDDLTTEDRPRFWEFTDRGVNFGYLPPEQRSKLPEFFAWLGIDPGQGAAAGN
jgi:hypothetical protein